MACAFFAEALEERTLLHAYLYLDYGDNFAGGTLQGAGVTTGALLSHTSGTGININGPQLSDSSDNNYAAGTPLILNSFATFYGADSSALYSTSIAEARATIDAIVQRVYSPFDVTVIDLTSTSITINGKSVAAAANFDDVSNTLAASGDGHDSYVFVAQAIINGTTADSTTDPTQFVDNGYGGIASGLDFDKSQAGQNTHAGTALSLLRSDYSENKVSQTIAHEAGHLFGMTHVWRNDSGENPDPRASVGPYKDQLDIYSSSETMSYTSFSGFSVFSRLPMVANTKYDAGTNSYPINTDTSFLTSSPTPYDHMVADPGIGGSNVSYVTGSGANDIITITKASPTTATVTVQPFSDAGATYTTPINIPGQATATYTYTIDITRPIVIDGGDGSDRFVIDGDLGTSILVRGDSWSGDSAGKVDSLIVNGKGAISGSYTPSIYDKPSLANGSDRRGTIQVGSTVIDFQEFTDASTVAVTDVTNFAMNHPDGGVSVVVDSPVAGQDRVRATVGSLPLIPLSFSNVTNLTINTGTGDDDVRIAATPAPGLQWLAVNTGAGNDHLEVNSNAGLFDVSGGIHYDGGLGINDLSLTQSGGPTRDGETYTVLTNPGSGSDIIVDGASIQSVFFQNLAPVLSLVPAPLTVVGTNANNVINYSQGLTPNLGLVAVDNTEPITFANKPSLTLRGLGGDDTITINNPSTPSGLTAINAIGGSGNNSLVINAQGVAVTSAMATATTVSIPGQLPVDYSSIQQVQIYNSTDALTSTPTPVKAVEGAQAQDVVIGSFAFSDAVPPTLFANPGDFTALINWGDGTTTAGTIVSLGTAGFEVRGTHTYATFGTYPVAATITDKGSSRTFTPTGGTAPVTITSAAGSTAIIATAATVADAPLNSQGAAISGIEGLPLSTLPQGVLVATFTDLAPGGVPADYTATIAWGDGATSPATQIVATGSPNGVTFLVFGNHTYADEGEYALSVTIKDAGGSQTEATSLVHIADAPLTAGPVVAINTAESPIFPVPVFGAPIFSGLVGTFSDANVNAPASDFRATIDWGDGTAPTFGTVVAGTTLGTFNVFGSHTYADSKVFGGAGLFTVAIRIDDEGGSVLTITNTATVLDNPIVLTGALDTASDSGLSNTDAITNVNHPVFKGTSEPRSVVTVFATPLIGGPTRPIGQTTAGSDGSWQVTSSLLTDGQYAITASAIDQFGHTRSGTVTLLPNAAQGALVIDTVGPKVTNVFFDRLNGQIDVVYQDERSGMNGATLVDSSNYSLTKPNTRPATYLVTELTPSSSSDPTAPVTVPVTLNSGKSLRGGFYTFTIRSYGPSNHEGVRDVAGNALDGEFYGKFPSGNAERGGDFVAMLDAVHRRIFAPQTVVGTASPANDGQGGAPVGAVHSGVFTQVRPRLTPAHIYGLAASRQRTAVHVANTPNRLAGQHPAGPLKGRSAR